MTAAPGDGVTVSEMPIASRSAVRLPWAGDDSDMAKPSLSKSQQQIGNYASSPVK